MQLLLLAIIFGEFSFYVATRQVVNVLEFLLAWTGHKYVDPCPLRTALLSQPALTHHSCFSFRRVLRAKLRDARTYEDWKEAAIEMDEHLGFDLWKSGQYAIMFWLPHCFPAEPRLGSIPPCRG